jgi:hypothetical protein
MATAAQQDSRTQAAYALAAVVWAWFAWRFNFVCDDAFISFRYSHHLAAGSGLVYDTARAVPVEGYSNFLWVVWLSLFERLEFDTLVVARYSALACSLLLLLGTMRLAARRFLLGPGGLAATGLFLSTLPAFGLWSTGGLATMPSALAIFGVLSALHSRRDAPRILPAIACATLATLLRADGIGYIGLILAASLVAPGADPAARRRMRIAVASTLAAVATVSLAHAVWRHGFYGEWVPNTAKIKAGLSAARLERGLIYAASFLVTLPAVLMAIGMGARRWREGPISLLLTAGTLVAGSFGYCIWVGGDFMPFGRFLVPALPAIALLFAWGFSRLAPKPAWALTLLCCLASAAEAYDRGPAPASLRRSLHFRKDREFQTEVARWQEMQQNAAAWDLWGRALAQHTDPGESIILGGIGVIGYRAPKLLIYDTYGLVTPEVAASAEPLAEASPGHDIRVQNDFFLKPEILRQLPTRPTYLGAQVGLARPLTEGELAPDWLITPFPDEARLRLLAAHLSRAFGVRLELETIALSSEDGFPENSVLHLLRLHHNE